MIYIIITLSVLLAISVFYCFKFAIIILSIQESIEKSLDILDEKYEVISEILSIPLFHDSREVRQVLSDIDDARTAIVEVAAKLSLQEQQEEE